MGYAEYPSTNYADTDLRELIELYKDLNNKYAGTLDRIEKLEGEYEQFKDDVQKKADELVKQRVDALEKQFSAKLEVWENELQAKQDLLQGQVDSKLRALDGAVSQNVTEYEQQLDAKFLELRRQYEGYWESLKQQIEKRVQDLEARVTDVTKLLTSSFQSLAEEQRAKLAKWISDTWRQLRDQLKAELEDFESRLADLEYKCDTEQGGYIWNFMMYLGGMSCYDWYDYVDMTCDCWNCSEITCYEWVLNARERLGFRRWRERVISPITGEWSSLYEIVLQLCMDMRTEGMTAGEYDALQITAEEFDSWRFTGMQWDWRGGETRGLFKQNCESESAAVCGD